MEKRLVLNSWKEIADYMGRGVRTIQRYERDLHLPVHRPAGKSRSAVIAFADEIDQWMRKGSVLRYVVNGDTKKNVDANIEGWQRLIANSEKLAKRADILKTQMSELLRLMQETERRRKLMLHWQAPKELSQALSKKTAELRSKMEEISELMARGGKSVNGQTTNPPLPVPEKHINKDADRDATSLLSGPHLK